MKLNWKDLITTPDGRISHSKVYANVGGLVATWVIIRLTLKDALTWDVFALYLGTVGGFYYVIGKWLDLKHGNTRPPSSPDEGALPPVAGGEGE